jgi:hypothetical protein
MLYIHKLFQLTPKAADIESVSIMREIRERTPYPIDQQKMQDYLGVFFVSEIDKEYMALASSLVKDIMDEAVDMIMSKDPIYEPINLQRSINLLKDLPKPLNNNLHYADSIFKWQSFLLSEVTNLLNSIPTLRSDAERKHCNDKLNKIFEKILGATDFTFNSKDLINEGQKEAISSLYESINKGFIFHISLEEEIKKLDFSAIRSRIPAENLAKLKSMQDKIEKVKIGIDRAYDLNMRMINMSVILYAYIKWMMSMKS